MHIVVALKQVHDPNTPQSFMAVGADGKSLDLHSAASVVLNAYDANAVEEAIRLKEQHGGTVTAITVGDKSAVAHVRRAIAMGADKGVHVEGPTGIEADAQLIASLLAAAIARLDRVDLVLCGRQASDTDAGQVPFILAEKIGAAAISPVIAVQLREPDSLVVDRISDGATQRLRVLLPAVLGISNEVNKPRVPNLKGVMASKKADIPTLSSGDLGIDSPSPALRLERLTISVRPALDAELLSAASGCDAGRALAERLQAEGYF